jgi:hypothetical protein
VVTISRNLKTGQAFGLPRPGLYHSENKLHLNPIPVKTETLVFVLRGFFYYRISAHTLQISPLLLFNFSGDALILNPSFNELPFNQTYYMTEKNKKQFGVWMDSRIATIAGRKDIDNGDFIILGQVINPGSDKNADEKSSNNKEITLTLKFFKEIAHLMPNIDEIHITGTGQIQEQFMKFLADTPQYKNAVSSESTSNKIGDEQLIELVTKYFN